MGMNGTMVGDGEIEASGGKTSGCCFASGIFRFRWPMNTSESAKHGISSFLPSSLTDVRGKSSLSILWKIAVAERDRRRNVESA